MSKVLVVDTKKRPLNPVHPGRARILLSSGQAAVYRHYPFTVVLKKTIEKPCVETLRVKIDPGSKNTGIAVFNDASDVPLQEEHVQCRAKLGSSRASNLALACESCNVKKGDPERLKRILAQLKAQLHDAAAVNSTRLALYGRLQALGPPVETGSGGLTKYNRNQRGLPKTHWLDAACVGNSTPGHLEVEGVVPLLSNATGHGSRQMCLMDRHGFPRTAAKQVKLVEGFQTGDIVQAIVTRGKKVGTYVGRVAIRATGYFNITTQHGTVQGISHRSCTRLHRCDGYRYHKGDAAFSPSPVPGMDPYAAVE